jgi:glycerol-1-phosphate dehydrogenase [NAD(P)+]
VSTLYLQRGLLGHMPDLLAREMPHTRLGIICDETTQEVAAAAIHALFPEHTQLICLGKRIRPTVDISEKLRHQVARCDALLAVGSGTITDLTRYVAHRLLIPFCAFATAPSMNGYLSATSSLVFGKHKSSVKASPPKALFADLDILCDAPLKLIRAGLGDILCRSSIESDLILANRFTGALYQPHDFDRLRQIDEELSQYGGELHKRDEPFIRLIMEALIIGGQLMTQHGSSAPCSQSEHMIAHTYDMLYGGSESYVLHGEAIAVTTLTMARLQQKLICRRPKLRPTKVSLDSFKRIFGANGYEALYNSYIKKQLSPERCEELNDELATLWPEIKAEIEAKAMRALSLEKTLARYNCYTDHKQLRWHKDRFENAVSSAYLTRDRFTFLDIPAMDKTLRAEL